MVILPVYDTIYSDLTPKGLLKMTIRRNWQHKTKKNKTKAQHNMHNQRQTTKKSLNIPKGGNQNPYIEEEQTTQRQKEEFEDTKGAIRIRISKKNKQHKGQ